MINKNPLSFFKKNKKNLQTKLLKFKKLLLKLFKYFSVVFFGLLFTLILFESSLFIFGRVQRILQNRNNNISNNDEFVILCLGESTTASVEMKGKDFSWPALLETLLNEAGLDKKVKIINEGITATNSNIILDNLEKNLNKYQPDLVITMMGINDYGYIKYEEAAGINRKSFLSKFKIYRLIKFLIANFKEKYKKEDVHVNNCTSENSCVELGSKQNLDKLTEREFALECFQKALNYNANSVPAMIGISSYYQVATNGQDGSKVLKYLQKALDLEPQNGAIYPNLIYAAFSLSDNKRIEWIEVIKNNLKRYNIKNEAIFVTLADYEKYYGNKDTELFYLEQALNASHGDYSPALLYLARYYVKYEKWLDAEYYYLKILHSSSPNKALASIELAQLYENNNLQSKSDYYWKKALDSKYAYVYNYKKLYQKLQDRKIWLVAVQYPMREIKPIETIFKDKNQVLLIENKNNFQNLVKEIGYQNVFSDSFAGDFGHCTKEGNLLLAENIKATILENWDLINEENN